MLLGRMLEDASKERHLEQENIRLHAENKALRERLTSLSFGGHRSPSLSPDDSISNCGSKPVDHPVHQPATRPSHYRIEVLWSLEDCKQDPDVNISQTNRSRPSMARAIRHADGTFITNEWLSIKATARRVKLDLMDLPAPRSRRAKNKPKTKTYCGRYFFKEWSAALEEMEKEQPLLALCAAHWKADHVLGNTLLEKPRGDIANSNGDEDDEDKGSVENNDKSTSSILGAGILRQGHYEYRRSPLGPPLPLKWCR